jgi:hypothetical protein
LCRERRLEAQERDAKNRNASHFGYVKQCRWCRV